MAIDWALSKSMANFSRVYTDRGTFVIGAADPEDPG